MVVMILMGSTSSELTFSAFDLSVVEIIINIRSLNFGSSFYRLMWHCCLFLFTSMPNDAHTFNACDEMMSGWQDNFMLKLALQPVGDGSPVSPRFIVDYIVAGEFTAKVFMKLVGNRSATIANDSNQWQLVFCACSKDWRQLIYSGDRSPTLLRPY